MPTATEMYLTVHETYTPLRLCTFTSYTASCTDVNMITLSQMVELLSLILLFFFSSSTSILQGQSTALVVAIECDYFEFAILLVKHGANVHAKSSYVSHRIHTSGRRRETK